MASKLSRGTGYVGETKTQLRHGYGVYKYPNEFFTYEGEWKEGKKHGHGKLLMADGSFYEGEFINGEIEGHGFRKWASSGNTYSGQFCNGELNGYGVMSYGNGMVYEGEFQNNKREGRGMLKYRDGSIYEGTFHNNVRHGEGSQSYACGDHYLGDWVLDKRQGSGELKYVDGSIYDGQWRNDFFNGEGTLIHSSGVTYEGMWINGRPAVEAARIHITTETPIELSQGIPFTLNIEIQSEDGELVEHETGREFQITAGFKHYVPTQGSPLFDLIEEMEETPISTPFYDVISYPLTEFSFIEEKLQISLDTLTKPSTAYSDVSSIGPSLNDEAASRYEETVPSAATEQADPPTSVPQEQTPINEDLPPKPDTALTKPDTIITRAETVPDVATEADFSDDPEAGDEVHESPVPPPVSVQRSENGCFCFKDVILPGCSSKGPQPLTPVSSKGVTPPSTASAKSTKSRGKAAKKNERRTPLGSSRRRQSSSVSTDDLPIKLPDQIAFEKIKDQKVLKAKREKLYGDERFARPGEYIIMITEVTNPPFLGKTLPTAYCQIRIQHPKKSNKKAKTPTKTKSGSKVAD